MANQEMASLTKTLVYAAANDAAERSKRARHVDVMDDEAWEAYQVVFNRLFSFVGGPTGWIHLPAR